MSKAQAPELNDPSHVNNYSRPNGQNVRTLQPVLHPHHQRQSLHSYASDLENPSSL